MEAAILFRFAVVVAVLPWFIALSRRVRDPRDYAPLAIAFYLLCGVEAATVIERVFGVEIMDVVQHALLAAAGIAGAAGALTVRRGVMSRRTAA